MYSHGKQVRREWKVTIRTSLGTLRVEWRTSEEAAELLREQFEVVSIELADHELDF